MKKKDRDSVIVTVIVGIIFTVFTTALWYVIGWYILLITLPCTVVLEIYLLEWVDKKHVIQEKQKLISLGIVTSADTQIVSKDTEECGRRPGGKNRRYTRGRTAEARAVSKTYSSSTRPL